MIFSAMSGFGVSCDRMHKAGHTEVAAGIFRVAAEEPPAGKFDAFLLSDFFLSFLYFFKELYS